VKSGQVFCLLGLVADQIKIRLVWSFTERSRSIFPLGTTPGYSVADELGVCVHLLNKYDYHHFIFWDV
jgi:hypothetical protein